MKKILVLLSGGIDSAVVLAASVRDHQCDAVGYDYGQLHRIELEHAKNVANHYQVPFSIKTLPEMPLLSESDVVFAGRNLVLVAHAIAQAAAEGFHAVALGCNASDWQCFADCRPVFWRSVETAAEAYMIRVLTPLIYYSKDDVVKQARKLGVPIELTWSCYLPQNGEPCGLCLACKQREAALA